MRTRARRGAPARRRRAPSRQLRLGTWTPDELLVDLFAGGGGTSEGIKAATGRDPDVAINHDHLALAMHEANHPATKHFCENVFRVDPREVTSGRPVGLLWLSPDCTHFSKSKGGKPRSKKIRGLAWVACRWVHDLGPRAPRVIILENVEEFETWGPLLPDGLPDPARAGKTFRAFVRKLESYGYRVEWRTLVAADFGVPTTRKRLFLIARRDGLPIVWPTPTHAKEPGKGRKKWRPASEVIDWSIPTPSIFSRKKPLAENTLRRIAVGLWRHVIEAARPFIVPVTHPRDARVHAIDEPVRTVTAANRGELALVAPAFLRTDMQSDGRLRGIGAPDEPLRTITSSGGHAIAAATLVTTGHGEREGQTPRAPGVDKPLGTVVATAQNHGVTVAHLVKHYGSPPDRMRAVGSDLDEPAGTVTAKDHHALSAAFLEKMYGSARSGADARDPVPTITSGGDRGGGHIAPVTAQLEKHGRRHVELVKALLRKYDRDGRLRDPSAPVDERTAKALDGVVTILGEDFQIVDVGMRMLVPRELFRAQGFGEHYVIAPICDQVRGTGKKRRIWRGPMTKTQQTAKAGNSVCPPLAEILVRSNLGEREAVAA